MSDLTDAQDTRTHHVYRIFDSADRLLYVGCTQHVDSRIETFHMRPWYTALGSASWAMWGLIDHWTSGTYPTKATARAAEIAAIGAESPLFNNQHNSGRHITREKYDELYVVKDEPTPVQIAARTLVDSLFLGRPAA